MTPSMPASPDAAVESMWPEAPYFIAPRSLRTRVSKAMGVSCMTRSRSSPVNREVRRGPHDGGHHWPPSSSCFLRRRPAGWLHDPGVHSPDCICEPTRASHFHARAAECGLSDCADEGRSRRLRARHRVPTMVSTGRANDAQDGALPRALLINGTVGVGKTTVAAAVCDLLVQRQVPNALIDVDGLRKAWPSPPQDPFNMGLALRNLASVAANYVEAGVTHLILAGVYRDADRSESVRGCAGHAAHHLSAAG